MVTNAWTQSKIEREHNRFKSSLADCEECHYVVTHSFKYETRDGETIKVATEQEPQPIYCHDHRRYKTILEDRKRLHEFIVNHNVIDKCYKCEQCIYCTPIDQLINNRQTSWNRFLKKCKKKKCSACILAGSLTI